MKHIILGKLSGRTIEVVTGLAVIDTSTKTELLEHEITKVQIKNMNSAEIKRYVATKEPLDKAGAFGIMDQVAVLVERIEGDFYNVAGLPLHRLSLMLEKCGIKTIGREEPEE